MADSYNELFGLGSHSEDANIEGWWPFMDNAASTTVVDQSSNGNNGTLNGGENTADITTTGPNSYLTACLDHNGFATDTYIDLGLSALGSNDATVLVRVQIDNDPPAGSGQTGFMRMGEAVTSNGASHYVWSGDSKIYSGTWRGTGATTNSRVTVGDPTEDLTTWRNICVKTTPGAGGWQFRIDSTDEATASGESSVYTSGSWWFGRVQDPTFGDFWFDGQASDLSIWSRKLSDAEDGQWADGPELINAVAPVLSGTEEVGQTLSCTTGTWALDSPFSGGTNGTAVYSYQWTRSNDSGGSGEADISGATSSTYTLQGADSGKYIRCRVRATNDGGYDADADTVSNMSGAIAGASGSPTHAVMRGANLGIRRGMAA